VAVAATPLAAEGEAPARPNILLVVFEDMSPHIGAYGDPVARTPVLDGFAETSVLYERVFTTAGVCAPSRAALITGQYQQSFGAQHMRTSFGALMPDGSRQPYETVPPPEVKAFPELLRAAGYYTTNNGKTDYQFGGHTTGPFTIWDENPAPHPWRGRPAGQPFFGMVNIMETHESYLFTDAALEASDDAMAPRLLSRNRQAFGDYVGTTDPASVVVPPYLPDTPEVRKDLARLHDNVTFAERQLGTLLRQLDEDGLAQNTIVIVTTDHGDGLPRAKRSVYDSGLMVPLMIRWPDGSGRGTRDGELVSFVDFGPTILSMAGVHVPTWMHGRVFAGDVTTPERGYIYAASDRHDEVEDRYRAVRDWRWKYIRNYQPDHAFYQHLSFRDILPTMQELWRLHQSGELTPAQEQYFAAARPAEELYDTWSDPHELINLAGDEVHHSELERLRAAHARFLARVDDYSTIEESQMLARMWPNLEQPATAAPTVREEGGMVVLQTATQGASIGYRVNEGRWLLYTEPFAAPPGAKVEAKAIRYGFSESGVNSVNMPAR